MHGDELPRRKRSSPIHPPPAWGHIARTAPHNLDVHILFFAGVWCLGMKRLLVTNPLQSQQLIAEAGAKLGCSILANGFFIKDVANRLGAWIVR